MGLGGARALFGKSFQPAESLKALAYFEGGDLATLEAQTRAALVGAFRSVRALPQVPILSKRLGADAGD